MNRLSCYKAALIISLLHCTISYGQGVEDAWLQTESSTSGNVLGTFHIYMTDTLDCDLLSIELGSSENSSDILQVQLQYDDPTLLPSGMSYYRSGEHIRIGLGTFTDSPLIWARVRSKETTGTWTAWWSFVK